MPQYSGKSNHSGIKSDQQIAMKPVLDATAAHGAGFLKMFPVFFVHVRR
jgi:hypothetical protein